MYWPDVKKVAVAALLQDAHHKYGWLSDAQDANLEADENIEGVFFCGEGSIDVSHAVSIVLDEVRKALNPDT